MCQVTLEEKLKAVPVMLTGDTLHNYANNVRDCGYFHKAMGLLREWYNSDDQKSRILSKWKSMTLTDALCEEPEKSEAEVFRKFVAKLMTLQNQLDTIYHTDQYLHDRLMTAINIPSIQSAIA